MRNTCTDNSGWSGWSILVKKKSVIISYIRCRPIQGSIGGSHICSFFKIFFLFLKSYKIKLVTASTKLSINSKNKQLLSFTYHKIYPSKVYNGEGNGTPLQYSWLENPMDGGPWWAAVHGVAKSQTRLSDFTFTFHFHALEKEMATHFSVLAWRIPGMGEPGELPSMGSHRVGHNWRDLAAAAAESHNMFLSFFFIGLSHLAFVVVVQPLSHVWLFVMP